MKTPGEKAAEIAREVAAALAHDSAHIPTIVSVIDARFAAAIRARDEEWGKRLAKTAYPACVVCWTQSWEPCAPDDLAAVKMPDGATVACACCTSEKIARDAVKRAEEAEAAKRKLDATLTIENDATAERIRELKAAERERDAARAELAEVRREAGETVGLCVDVLLNADAIARGEEVHYRIEPDERTRALYRGQSFLSRCSTPGDGATDATDYVQSAISASESLPAHQRAVDLINSARPQTTL